MNNQFLRGSEWRKWDLHVHTASSYDSKYKSEDSDEILVQAWKENEIAAVAITDHFLIDKERIENLRKIAPEITIFPGVELRTDKGATNIHVILIFSEKMDLQELIEDFNSFKRNDAVNPYDNDKIYWDFNKILKFAEVHNALVSLHAGAKSNGVDDQITNSVLINQAIKEEYAHNVNFFEMGKKEDIHQYKKHVLPTVGEKPLIICSDNHDPRQYMFKENLWIKADTTFDGLIQCIYQPEERVFVGNIPTKLDKTTKNKQTYIESILVKKVDAPKNTLDNWFDFDIPINSGLTTIIGNKGSGKSALSDIIGHFCQSHAIKHASFLHPDRFRNSPKNLSNDYLGAIRWLDGKVDDMMTLGVNEYTSTIENAQYLPQRYIELVCNELGNEFQNEINKVIFSYVDVTEKGNSKNLEELVDNKSATVQTRIKELQAKLDEINADIIITEGKLVTTYKKGLSDNLKKRTDDLFRHDKNKPSEVLKPEKSQTEEYVEQLRLFEEDIIVLEKEIDIETTNAKELNEKIVELNNYKDEIVDVINRINSLNQSLLMVATKYEINAEVFKINYTEPLLVIDEKIKELTATLKVKKALLDTSEQADENVSLHKKVSIITTKKMDLISQSDAGEKSYQKYLIDLKDWEKIRLEIIGDKSIEGTIVNLKDELNHVENILPYAYSMIKEERLIRVSELFALKQAKANLYSEIYRPVEKELEKLLSSMEDKVEFAVNITVCDKDINSRLLDYVSKQFRGIFGGITESQNKMHEIISKFDFNNTEDVHSFICEVLKCIDEDMDNSSKKVKDKKGFYNLLTFLDYLDAEYSLKMSGKGLKELSAGQRGIVLLIFYLALSKNEIPIIIDQPEDNLDNQSVFDKLVPCIREAKKKRQVIIVTHNPNIAIACDAEQIICCNISKTDNQISYISGSIENQEIRNHVIDVLEGTMPAFDLRRKKYSN